MRDQASQAEPSDRRSRRHRPRGRRPGGRVRNVVGPTTPTEREKPMAEVTQQQVVDYIKGLSVLELSQLVNTLESELGVSAAAAMPGFAGAAPGAAGGGAAAPAEAKTEATGPRTDRRTGQI